MRSAWAGVLSASIIGMVVQVDVPPDATAEGATWALRALLWWLAPGAELDVAAIGRGAALALSSSRGAASLLASGLLLALVFGTRAVRAQSRRELALHLGLAFASGIAASWVGRAQDRTEVVLWLTALTVAAVLASLPWLLPAEGRRAIELRRLAGRAEGRLRWRLLRASVVARRVHQRRLPRAARRRAERALDELATVAERRLEGRASARTERELARLAKVARAIAS